MLFNIIKNKIHKYTPMSYFPLIVAVESMLRIFIQWEAHMLTLEQTTQVQKHSTSNITHPDDEAT